MDPTNNYSPRRLFLKGAGSLSLVSAFPRLAQAEDVFGQDQSYPTGWGPTGQRQQWEGYTQYHVGNFSGGLEKMFPSQRIKHSQAASPLKGPNKNQHQTLSRAASDLAKRFNASSILIARDQTIFHEDYRFDRKPQMRFFGWSMTKSVVSLLFGIALDKKLINAIDDPVVHYVKELKGHALADTTLRNLLNMSSGADICQEMCSPKNSFERYEYSQIGYSPHRAEHTDMKAGLLDFHWGRNVPQGSAFNYTEICPQLIALVLESVFNQPLYKIAEHYLWQPMGAEQDAVWLTDSKGFAIASAGFSATLRDWARLGMLIANHGVAQGQQIISKSWIDECCKHGPKDQQVKFNNVARGRGYRNFFWHVVPDGSVIRMAGAKGQFVVIDRKTKTVLVRTGVSDERGADEEMMALFYQACKD